jgi:hypothetical protein
VRGIGLKIGTLGDRAIPRCTLRHEEKGPNPSKPTGLGVNQGPPRVPHGRGKVLLKDRAKKTEEPRDRGKRRAAAAVRRRERKGRAGGEEMGKRNNCGGLIYRSKKKALPVLPASGAGTTGGPETCERNSVGFWHTGATGLWPVPPAGAGTISARRRYHR